MSAFIQPCLPSRTERPPCGPGWVHEIKHDGFRLMVRRDSTGIRLITRNGHDWSDRYPLIRISAAALPVRSCLIDGEAVCCDEDGLAVFQKADPRRATSKLYSSGSQSMSTRFLKEALLGPSEMSDLNPQSGPKRTLIR